MHISLELWQNIFHPTSLDMRWEIISTNVFWSNFAWNFRQYNRNHWWISHPAAKSILDIALNSLITPPDLPGSRLLHSPNLVTVPLSVGYETWPPIGCVVSNVIGWYRLGNFSHAMHYGCMGYVGISTIFQRPYTVPFHSPNGRHLPAIRAVQAGCERVYPGCAYDPATPHSPLTLNPSHL